MPSAPSDRPLANASMVFSGASALPPRCAKTSGREEAEDAAKGDAKKGCMRTVIESSYGGHNSDIGRTPASASQVASGQTGNPREPRAQAADGRTAVPRHHRLRRNGR